MSERQDFIALDWVAGEIEQTLKQSARALEAFIVNRDDETQLRFCLTHLHQVHRTLQMVEFPGAALLAAEMEALAQALIQEKVHASHIDDALLVLQSATAQLPLYLEHVQQSRHGLPAALLPILNDLRAVRGESFVSESVLFAPDLSPLHAIASSGEVPVSESELSEIAQKLRQMFQIALLGVIRGNDVNKNLNFLAKVCARLVKLSDGFPPQHLWRVCIAVLEGLLNGSIEPSVAIKMLLRQVDRQIKALVDSGSTAMRRTPPEYLVKNLLYYVARSKSNSRFIAETKVEFGLDSALLGEDELCDNTLITPSNAVVLSVATALAHDLSGVRESIDSAAGKSLPVNALLAELKFIADAMAILGMAASLKKLQQVSDRLVQLAVDDVSLDEQTRNEISQNLTDLEASFRATEMSGVEEPRELFNDSEDAQEQLDRAFDSVVRESRQGLEQAREALNEFVATQWDRRCLEQVPELLTKISSSLGMLPLATASQVLVSCEQYVSEILIADSTVPGWQKLDTFADAITSVDYYLERLDDGGNTEERAILDVAIESVADLGYPITGYRVFDGGVDTSVTDKSAIQTAGNEIDDESDIDPEILDIFVEEVGEVLEAINGSLPCWVENTEDREAGATVRRAFHTLKGSGRMVGASDIGDLAWSIENMLNQVMDGSIVMDAPRLNLVGEARDAVPALIDAFEHAGSADKPLVESIILRASAFAVDQQPNVELKGDEADSELKSIDRVEIQETPIKEIANAPNFGLEKKPEPEQQPEAEVKREPTVDFASPREGQAIDAELLEIFAAEATAHGQVLDDFIAHCRELAGPAELTDDLQRALHTLKGSANMAGITPVVTIVTPLEYTIKELRASQLKVDDQLLAMLERGSLYIKAGIEQLMTTPLQAFSDADNYIAELAELFDRRIASTVNQGSEDCGIPPEALNHFLTASLDLIMELSGKLVLWQEGDFERSELEVFEALMNDFVRHAESVKLSAPVEFGNVLQAFYSRGSMHDEGHPGDAFFQLAERGNDCLIDMLDQIAGQQTPSFEKPLLNEIRAFTFEESEPKVIGEIEMDLGSYLTNISDGQHSENSGIEGASSSTESDSPAIDGDDYSALFGDLVDDELVDALTEDAELMADSAIVELDFDAGVTLAASVRDTATIVSKPESMTEEFELPEAGTDIDDKGLKEPAVFAFSETSNFDEMTTVLTELVDAIAPQEMLSRDESKLTPDSSTEHHLEKATDDNDDVDSEILEIFLEEADDLLESLDETIDGWSSERGKREHLDDMLRILHTLKGGARLTGLISLGNLSHDFETSLAHLEGVGGDISDEALALCQQYQDQLIGAVAAIKSGASFDEIEQASDAVTFDVDAKGTALIDHEAPAKTPLVAADALLEDKQIATPEPYQQPTEESIQLSDSAIETVPVDETVIDASDVDDFDRMFSRAENVFDEVSDSVFVEPVKAMLPRTVAPETTPSPVVDPAVKKAPQEMVKVSAQLLEELVNLAGETSISRGRAEEQISELVFSLDDMQITVDRLQEQVRRLDMETEQQILYRQEQVESEGLEGFDPLEMDRYSQLQQLSRSLLESSSDLVDIKSTLAEKSRDMETLLIQQSRINTDLQEGLMRSRMVPFSRMVPRLRRIVRQVSGELDKKVDFHLSNIDGELDRTVLERIVAPLEHMLRNAVDHGIESADERDAVGKPRRGNVTMDLSREGGEIVIRLSDDGGGVDLNAVKNKAVERGLMTADTDLSDHEIARFILQSGFSTATEVTQISGRGVGMDVVNSEIKQLGGSMDIHSVAGKGSRFTIRLPFTVSVNRALMVSVSGDSYAIPLNTIEGIVRVSPFELEAYYQPDAPLFEYAGQPYQLRYMGGLLNRGAKPNLDGQSTPLPVVLVRGAEHSVAVQVDSLMGSREIVVKPLGPQFSMVQGLSGATVLGDGNVVVILDLLALIRADASTVPRDLQQPQVGAVAEDDSIVVMVVDDSVTVRKVTSRLLERHGIDVLLAKDGVDAITQLNEMERIPDVMLLDIEMPRMDGFEVASRVRHSPRLQDIPIIMITSRTGEKHRDRALALGVNEYLGKPYQETELLNTINALATVMPDQ